MNTIYTIYIENLYKFQDKKLVKPLLATLCWLVLAEFSVLTWSGW